MKVVGVVRRLNMWREQTGNTSPFLPADPPREHTSCQYSSNFLCTHRESQLEHSSCARLSLSFWTVTLLQFIFTPVQIHWIQKVFGPLLLSYDQIQVKDCNRSITNRSTPFTLSVQIHSVWLISIERSIIAEGERAIMFFSVSVCIEVFVCISN